MTLDVTIAIDIIEVMENYIDAVRPRAYFRPDLNLGYEISGQSVILHEIRPLWRNPGKYLKVDYAKATYIKSKGIWRTYWRRADSEWHPYKPQQTVHNLRDFLLLVQEDKDHCLE